MNADPMATQAKFEAVGGAFLMAAPLWVRLLQEISLVASTFVAVGGAILMAHALWRLWKRHRRPDR